MNDLYKFNPINRPQYQERRRKYDSFIRTGTPHPLWHDTQMPTPGNPLVEDCALSGIKITQINMLSVKGFGGVGTGAYRTIHNKDGLKTL